MDLFSLGLRDVHRGNLEERTKRSQGYFLLHFDLTFKKEGMDGSIWYGMEWNEYNSLQ